MSACVGVMEAVSVSFIMEADSVSFILMHSHMVCTYTRRERDVVLMYSHMVFTYTKREMGVVWCGCRQDARGIA